MHVATCTQCGNHLPLSAVLPNNVRPVSSYIPRDFLLPSLFSFLCGRPNWQISKQTSIDSYVSAAGPIFSKGKPLFVFAAGKFVLNDTSLFCRKSYWTWRNPAWTVCPEVEASMANSFGGLILITNLTPRVWFCVLNKHSMQAHA